MRNIPGFSVNHVFQPFMLFQAGLVREMKAAKLPKAEWQPHVTALLQLKADLAAAQKAAEAASSSASATGSAPSSDSINTQGNGSSPAQIAELEDAIQKQVLLTLYLILEICAICLCISSILFFQGDLVRGMKGSGKAKAEWQPEVNKLLQLKQQLTALQPTTAPGSSAESKSPQSSGSGKSKTKKKK